MAEHVRVDVDLLEKVSALLIKRLREQEGTEVLLDHDYFWSVPAAQARNVYEEPVNLTIGQVTECLEWLRGVARNPDSAIDQHLIWLGDVLRAVGQKAS